MNRIAIGLVRGFSTGTVETERTLARRIELMEKQLTEQGEELAARLRWRTAFFVIVVTGHATLFLDHLGSNQDRMSNVEFKLDALRDQQRDRLADLDYRLGKIEKERQQTPLATEPKQEPEYGGILYMSMVTCAAAWAWFTK